MGLVTDHDETEDAVWFVNYTMNYLCQYLLADVSHSDEFLEAILTDMMLYQRCFHIAQDNKFARLIANSRTGRAIRQLKMMAGQEKVRIHLSKIKRLILQR